MTHPDPDATVTSDDEVTRTPEDETSDNAETAARFTQEDLDRAIEKRLARERRQHEKRIAELSAKLEKASTPTQTVNTATAPAHAPASAAASAAPADTAASDLARKFDELQAELRRQKEDSLFSDTLMEARLTLNRTQRELLRGQFDPDEPEAILEMAKSAFAVQTAQASSPTPNPSAPSVAQRGKPPELAAPAGDPDADLPTDITRLQGDQLARLKSDPQRFREYLKQARSQMVGGGSPFPFGGREQKG